jgi:hypothetical protein
MTQPVPPGWYPDPSGKPGQMFWDGQRWVPPAGPPQNPVPASLRRRWTSLRTRTKIAAVVAVVGIMAFTVWVSIGVTDSVFGSSDPSPAAQSLSGHMPISGGVTCNPAWTCGGGSSGAQSPTKLGPDQQRKEEEAAGNLCDSLKYYGWDNEVTGVQVALDWMSEADAINFIKKTVSTQCPELLKNIPGQ